MQPKSERARPSGREISEGTWNGKPVRFFAGQVIVKLRRPTPRDEARSLSEQMARELPGGRVKRGPGPTGRLVLQFDQNQDVLEIARKLGARPDVEYAEPDVVQRIQGLVPNDSRYRDQWAHHVIGSEGAWALQTGGPGVLIGIIDTGISMTLNGALDHADLDTAGRYILGSDFVDGGTLRATYTDTARTSPVSRPPSPTTPRELPE